MTKVHQNPSQKHLKLHKYWETSVVINTTIGKVAPLNPKTEISNHASIAAVINTQVKSAGLFIQSLQKGGLFRRIQQMSRTRQCLKK